MNIKSLALEFDNIMYDKCVTMIIDLRTNLVIEQEVKELKAENQRLKRSRGFYCSCVGSCKEHREYGKRNRIHTPPFKVVSFFSAKVPAKKPQPKRKTFATLTTNGRRRGLREIRNLFKKKQAEYKAPISKLAGFIIQQVGH